jgi:hypothetical protein
MSRSGRFPLTELSEVWLSRGLNVNAALFPLLALLAAPAPLPSLGSAPAPTALPALPGRWFESPAGYGFRLPPGFAPDPSLPSGVSAAAAPVLPDSNGTPPRLDAVFSDVAQDGGSSLFVAAVDAPLPEGSFVPERLASMALDYLKDELGSDLKIEWVDRVPAAGDQVVELAGRFSLYGQERVAQVAFVPDGNRYFVVSASLPKDRFGNQGPQIEAALASFRFTGPRQSRLSEGELGAIAGAALGLGVALELRRRRNRQKPRLVE